MNGCGYAGLALLLCLASACDRRTPLGPGEYTSILPEVVRTFEYETSDFLLVAHRFSLGEPFRVVLQQRAMGVVHQCSADPPLGSLMEKFESLYIRRHVGEPEAETLKKGAPSHRLRYTADPPMEAYEEILYVLPNGNMLVESDGFAYELTLNTRLVEQLGRACR